jgi:hypothetical protein
MKRGITIVLVLALVSTAGFAERIGRVVGVEAGYGYLTQGSSALFTSLYYRYLLGDKPSSQNLLSLALGYTWFPEAASGEELHSLVYGLEYAHTFFASHPVALVLDYGLLFNLLLQSGRQGYAFAHHTRLRAGSFLQPRPARPPAAERGLRVRDLPLLRAGLGPGLLPLGVAAVDAPLLGDAWPNF